MRLLAVGNHSGAAASVQGKPCVDCGKVEPKMVANHKTPLMQEYYQTGKIDKARNIGSRTVDNEQKTL